MKNAGAQDHHGEQDPIVYAASGHGSVVSEDGKKRHVYPSPALPFLFPFSSSLFPSLQHIKLLLERKQKEDEKSGKLSYGASEELSPSDFALIPAWTEHQEINDGDEEVTWIITRSGGAPVVVNLEGWGGSVKKE
ncbi:hypothetical protein BDZ45DRAFT_729923 [Acephala macrosclerotiorum]|nr:hypothetical protein BDZ45DRAFT_729923 [Acephala macrosclerotiorum]